MSDPQLTPSGSRATPMRIAPQLAKAIHQIPEELGVSSLIGGDRDGVGVLLHGRVHDVPRLLPRIADGHAGGGVEQHSPLPSQCC